MAGFFLLHVELHVWVIKFIIWPAVALACDYPGNGGGSGTVCNLWETKGHGGGHLGLFVDAGRKTVLGLAAPVWDRA